MTELKDLKHADKVFLAGCIRSIILADGNFPTASELADLDKIYRSLGLHDYEACLEDFEGRIDDEEDFMKAAKRVKSPEAQDAILGVAYELTLQNGVPNAAQLGIEKKLRALWKKP
jgi:hypothetical protein